MISTKILDMIHLHTKSCWSLLESPFTIERIIAKAKENHSAYAALTDRNTMYGTMEFLHACRKEGIKPIVGLEFDLCDLPGVSLIFLAADNRGLSDLYEISTLIETEAKNGITLEQASGFSSHCVTLTSGQDPYLADLINRQDGEKLMEVLDRLNRSFSQFYVSIAMNDSPYYRKINEYLKISAKSLGLQTTALSRIEYENPQDVQKVRLLQAIEAQSEIQNPMLKVIKDRWYRTDAEMEELYDQTDLNTSEEIAEKIDLSLPSNVTSLPDYVNKLSVPSEEYLEALAKAGLAKRLNHKVPLEYARRLDYELKIINQMGFANYFLIVWDYIRQARSLNILVGPGRGSAAGSVTAWAIGITHIDPIQNGLLFERFLNPERISMPDIDVDFPDNRRDEVIDYVFDLYGHDHVAHIVTFSTFKAKAALRDCARVMKIPVREVDELSKLLSNSPNLTLKDAYKTNEKFRQRIQSKNSYMELYQAACSIEGLPRHPSIHAGGIVFSKEKLTLAAPLADCGSHIPAVGFTQNYLEELGLIKFDFLGLKNLSLIESMNKRIEQTTGASLDLFALPLNDPNVYKLLRTGNTAGVFQLESAGIRSLIRRFQPQRFEDIAAILALYRPGPMKNIQLYLDARQKGKSQTLHPLLDPILAESNGIFLYQEQIMQAAVALGNFTMAQADSLRKAMSKKNKEEMEAYHDLFIAGAKTRNIEKSLAEELFTLMERFADYGFNKSHSYAYGLVVYWMAYIKANYPVQFYVSLLNEDKSDRKKGAAYISEAKKRGIAVYPVSINHSSDQYEIEKQGIRVPFSILKKNGTALSRKIIQERNRAGRFQTIYEAAARLQAAQLDEAAFLSLINIGAFDEFGYSRSSLRAVLSELMTYGRMVRVETKEVLFAYDALSQPEISPARVSLMEDLDFEMKECGFYLLEHPAIRLRKQYRIQDSVSEILEKTGKIALIGRIMAIKKHVSKKGNEMVFLTLDDEGASIQAIVMSWIYQPFEDQISENAMVQIEGKKDQPDSVMANSMRILKV